MGAQKLLRGHDASASLRHRQMAPAMGRVGSRFFSFFASWVGSTTAKVLKIEGIILMHLKHG